MTRPLIYIVILAGLLLSCSGRPQRSDAAPARTDSVAEAGSVSADSLMAMLRAQTDMGPRVPGSAAHARCADMLAGRLHGYGADSVEILESDAVAWDGTRLRVRNILARYGTELPSRVLLLAHYDTRPWADRDPSPDARRTPIDGANDGASGVAALLEIARNLSMRPAPVGVDILLTDCEDYGVPDGEPGDEDSWCLGAQAFAAALPYTPATMPRYGILLDMIGGRGARFHREYFSEQAAPAVNDRIWAMARRLDLGSRFPDQIGGAITDDHLPLIRSGIPTADIIECASPRTGSFPVTWHTLDDNAANIDSAAMRDVTRVVLNVIYNERP